MFLQAVSRYVQFDASNFASSEKLGRQLELLKSTINKILHRTTPNLFARPLESTLWGDLNGILGGTLGSLPQTVAMGMIIGGALGGSLSGIGLLIVLYCSALLGLAAAIFGGCPFIVAGPRVSTLLVFAALITQLSHSETLSHLANPTSAALILASTAVLFSGILQFFFGVFRLGQLAQYVPFPVMSGFVNGSALLIILSQSCTAMGISEQKSLWAFLNHINEIKPATLALSLFTLASMLYFPRLTKRVPPMPMAFFAGTAVYQLFAIFGFADDLGGTIPPPPLHYVVHFTGSEALDIVSGSIGPELFPTLLATALSMSILSSLETLFATAATDEMTLRHSNTNRQLMAEGLGNIMAGLLGLSPGSGSLVRSKAALMNGMKSVITPVGIALISFFVALSLGGLIGFMSKAVMAGLLIALGIGLFDKWTLARLSQLIFKGNISAASRSDLIVVGVVVTTALMANLTTAVGIGMVISILLFVMQMSRNPIRRCYPARNLIPRIYGDFARQNSLEKYGNSIAIIEIEGILFFGNISELESRVEALTNEGVFHVVLDLRRVTHVDSTGARSLERMNAKLEKLEGMLVVGFVDREKRNIQVQLKSEDKRHFFVSRKIWVNLADFGTIATIGLERFLSDTNSAIALCEKHLASKTEDVSEIHKLSAGNSPLIRKMERSKLRRLRRYLTRYSYKPDEMVFQQESPPDGAFFVVRGQLEVVLDLPGTDRKRKVRTLTSGSIFGEMSLIDLFSRSTNIIAVRSTTCYHLSAESFERLKIEQPDISFALLTATSMIFAERLRTITTMLAEMEA